MIAALALALALSTAPKAPGTEAAQMLDELRRLIPGGQFEGAVGDYAIYRMGSPPAYRYWRLAVVGREAAAPTPAVWLETTFGTQANGTGLLGLKILSSGDPRQHRAILKAYFRLGAGKTLEVDPAEVGLATTASDPDDRGEAGGAEGQGEQSVEVKMTPAGSFRALRAETALGYTLWLAPEVPVFHVVAVDLPSGGHLELYALGHDAKDTLGEPQGKTGPKTMKRLLQTADDGGMP